LDTILPGFAFGAYSWQVNSLPNEIIKAVLFEIFYTFFLISIFAFIWGLLSPIWIENILKNQYRKFITIIVFAIISADLYIVTVYISSCGNV
jgi:hypothetical protein